jgi:phosphate transport system substrate-binding protein
MAVSWVGAACGNEDDPADPTAIPVEHTIEIDGSSTVLLINRQVAEKYVDETPNVLIQLRSSGTGRGFQRFVEGGVDIVGASRAIEEAEAQLAADTTGWSTSNSKWRSTESPSLPAETTASFTV